MMVLKSLRLAPLALAALAATAQAQSDGNSMFTFSGFGTVGLAKTSTDEADFVISGQPGGATKKWSADVDTKLGVQVGAKFSSMFSATVQVMSKQNGDGNYQPEFEWAFAKAQFNPALSMRVGRMGGPFFAVSDFRDVGYANTWLRPPQDVYGQVPVSHFDGADLSYQTALGSSTLSLQLYGGKSSAVFEGVDVHMKSMAGFNATAELDGGFTLRLGHVQGKLSVDSTTLAGLVTLLRATPFAAVGEQLAAVDKKASFTGVGLAWDHGDWLANFEYTMRRTDTYVPDTDGWYLTLGHRFGKFTPYLTVSELKQKDNNVNNTIPAGVKIPSPPAPFPIADLKAVVDKTLYDQSNQQKTVALGLRWDAYRNVAVKAQYERITPTGPGLFANPQATFGSGKVSVYSVAVDFVF